MTGSRPPTGWQGSGYELGVAVILVIAVTTAAYGWAGTGAAVLTLSCAAFLALFLLRTLSPPESQPDPQTGEWEDLSQGSIHGFWRKRGMLRDATDRMVSYDNELRPTLQHLLAARLSDKHGVSLHDDPDEARRLLLRRPRDQHLWPWLDPGQPPAGGQGRGIPPRTLAAIIDRLERL
jgi:hypothetical protein